jgi:hypothetical protein
MSRSPLAIVAVVALITGCVSVTGPSASPSTTPRPATPTPSAAPTATPTSSPAPTAAPTASAAPSASSGPTAQPSGDLGFDQRDVIFFDDLTDASQQCTAPPPNATPAGCWGVGDVTTSDGTPVGSIHYVSGALNIAVDSAGSWLWSRRVADSTSASMRVIGDFYPAGDGRFGLLCLSGDAQLYGALVGTDGSWAFVSIGDNGAEELLGDDSAGLNVLASASNVVALECTGTATGALRLTLWLGKSGQIATYSQADGPANFDRAGAYVEASSAGFSAAMDNVVLFGSRISDGSLGPEAQALLAHVPDAWQSSCYQGLRPPYLAATAEAVLTCFLPSHDGADIAEYAAFSSSDSMNAAYQSRIDAFGTGDGVGSCADGSGEHGYNISGTEAGRLLCVNQVVGIRFDWTDTRLNILSTLVDFDGSYSSTFDDWGAGGPDL